MNICFLAGASTIHTVRWVNALVERGHKVHLLTMHMPELDKVNKEVKIYKLPFAPPLGYYLNVFWVKQLIKKIKPDILNTHYASGYGTLSRLVNFKPTLLSVWGSDVFLFPYESKSKQRILEKNLKSATQVASTSLEMKRQTEKFVRAKVPIAITPFGVELDKFRPLKSQKNSNTVTIGIVKRLEEIYGIKYLIEATSLLLRRLETENLSIKIKLLIVGEGSRLDELKNLAQKLEIADITDFLGAVPHDQVPLYLNKFDIYCAPSLSESFGVAVIEASSCELPVIVTNVGGLPEVAKDGETGYIVEPKNAEQIAERLYLLVVDKEKRERFGKNGRNFVDSLYNWEKNVTNMEKVYEDLIKIYNRNGGKQ